MGEARVRTRRAAGKPKLNGHPVELLPAPAERPAPAALAEVTITVTRATATQAVLAIGYVHPERGAEVVNVPLDLGGAVMLAHGLLGAVCSPAPIDPEEVARAADKVAVEAEAQRIYESWARHPGYVPWTPGGNSDRQVQARNEAWSELRRQQAEAKVD